MKIEVTQDDINKGKKGDIFNCPIARVIKRITKTKQSEYQDALLS